MGTQVVKRETCARMRQVETWKHVTWHAYHETQENHTGATQS